MNNIESVLKNKIEHIFGISNKEISELKNLHGSNTVYSFTVKNQKYVIHKLNDDSIIDWKNEKAAYDVLKPYNITDELVYYEDGIKIAKFLDGKNLSYKESDMIDSLNLLRKVHESGVSIQYNYNIIENMEKYISMCGKKTEKLDDLKNSESTINAIQIIVNKLKVQPVLCHGDACASTNFLRLSDGSIRMIDWEQAGMADPLLDIAIAALHQGFENVDPVWCLYQYLKRTPKKQEYLRLFSFLALDSYALAAWCIYDKDPEGYNDYFNYAVKYSKLVLE